MASLFGNVASPNQPMTAARMMSPSREEHGGSFFSFQSMDTSDTSGGLSVLSMFGNSSREPEPDPTFSFSFGGSPTESSKDSHFSFPFGGGAGGGRGRGGGEASTGSIFNLF